MKVLLIDDDPVVLEVVGGRLEDLQHQVVTHDRALGTAQMVLDHRPDVLLLDVNLPLLSGGQLLEIMRNKLGKTIVILHSSGDAKKLQHMAQSAGAAGAIVKGISQAEFAAQFQRLVGATRRPQA